MFSRDTQANRKPKAPKPLRANPCKVADWKRRTAKELPRYTKLKPRRTPRKVSPLWAEQEHLGQPKKLRTKAPDYLEWIRQQPCIVTGQLSGPGFKRVDPAHCDTVGSGGSDFTALPLSRLYHSEQHNLGMDTFAKKYGLDYAVLIAEHCNRFLIQGRIAA